MTEGHPPERSGRLAEGTKAKPSSPPDSEPEPFNGDAHLIAHRTGSCQQLELDAWGDTGRLRRRWLEPPKVGEKLSAGSQLDAWKPF